MGIPGAGKSRVAAELAGRGYLRLNRDERGSTLRALAETLDDALEDGEGRVVLDNTYLTRASRSRVVESARRHAVATRCLWLDTPLAQAQVNLVERLLERFDSLPTPEQLRASAREPGVLTPTAQMRALRELEPPTPDEGFDAIERLPFTRFRHPARAGAGVIVAAPALREQRAAAQEPGLRDAPHLVFDWLPDGRPADLTPLVAALAAAVAGPVEGRLCAHGGGPPTCWCRPPLPGLLLAFARERGVDLARSVLVGTSTAHRTLAATVGARFVAS